MHTATLHARPRLVRALMETFGLSPIAAFIVFVLMLAAAGAAVLWVAFSAPPRRITLTAGPPGSSFERIAERYRKELADRGLTVTVLPSTGSFENLRRLRDPKAHVDVGFVQGGLAGAKAPEGLVTLGSVSYQPMLLFYRSEHPLRLLSEFAGRRIAIGPTGSGTHELATALLAGNGISAENAILDEDDPGVAAADLQAGKVDAVFLMGDSAPVQTLRTLLRADGIRLFDWVQADAYVRRFPFLNKVRLPEGAIDLGKDLPGQDVLLVGPTVELVAHANLNAAISDMLLDVAHDIHSRAGILQKSGEFPAPLGHEYPLSEDAARYYKSGKSFIYRIIPSYWIASLINPILVVVVPAILLLVPAFRVLPVLYRMRFYLRIYRCYRPLLQLERDAANQMTPLRARELLERLDDVERLADSLRVPASFGDQFYELRGHILFVRRRLEAMAR